MDLLKGRHYAAISRKKSTPADVRTQVAAKPAPAP